MGDWAKGDFAAANQTAGKEFGCTIVGQHYLMGGDVFAFAKQKDANAAKAQATLAKVLLDPETQIKFAQKKGSIPIRNDIDVSSLDICAQSGMKLVADQSRQTPDVNLVAAPDLVGALDDVISEYWNSAAPNADAFVAKFATTVKNAL
jgi:glucose/mannose transport system substrate-binding protein